ncbi:hypothetical protein PHJA_001952400 [Phtheirospermum japonicum]|uniref:Uncharacterized protein n=1 Tax=Phtheirospermum japonicum TaxID=374723 RepID=A0A830CQF4_9LAMI|nr:hypothetical protein PHJA_001952400 [Phtheirospermum japonicum]
MMWINGVYTLLKKKVQEIKDEGTSRIAEEKPSHIQAAFNLPSKWDEKGSVIENYKSFGVVSNPNFLGCKLELGFESHDTDDDHTIAAILAEDEKSRYDGKLGKRLSHLDSIPNTPPVIGDIPDPNDATLDHERLAQRFLLCLYVLVFHFLFRAISDQLFQNQDYHKYVRKEVIKQIVAFLSRDKIMGPHAVSLLLR